MHHETNVADVINTIAAEVNMVLNKRQKEQYFDKVVLLYSFIENLLKWIVYIDIVWHQTKRYHKSNILVTEEEEKDIRKFCKRLRFYDAQTRVSSRQDRL
jgi:hypothetical protein